MCTHPIKYSVCAKSACACVITWFNGIAVLFHKGIQSILQSHYRAMFGVHGNEPCYSHVI